MDALTRAAVAIGFQPLTAVSMLLDNALFFALLVALIVTVAERRNSKRMKIVAALAVAVAAGLALKAVYAVERPCGDGGGCPEDYSFPSMHATVAFTLMLAFLDKRSYPAFLFFGLFVAFTRLHLGVHTFEDIAAAFPVAVLSYHLVDSRWKADFFGRGGEGDG